MRYSCPLSLIFHHPLKFVNRLTTRIAQQLLDVRQAVGLYSEHPYGLRIRSIGGTVDGDPGGPLPPTTGVALRDG